MSVKLKFKKKGWKTKSARHFWEEREWPEHCKVSSIPTDDSPSCNALKINVIGDKTGT